MFRRTIIVVATALSLAGGFAGALGPLPAGAQDATPAAEAGPPEGVTDVTLAFGMADALPATPAMVLIDRLTLAPGASVPGQPGDPTFAFILVESGTLAVQADTPLAVTRAAALAAALASSGETPATEEVPAHTDFTLAAGDSIVFPPLAGVTLRNDGLDPVVLLGMVIAPVS